MQTFAQSLYCTNKMANSAKMRTEKDSFKFNLPTIGEEAT
jgi:hypothetical protein